MDNISWGNFGLGKVREEEIKEVISSEEFITSKEELLKNCIDLLNGMESLYNKVSSKELHDAFVTLGSVKRSLNNIHIKVEEDDQRRNYRIPEHSQRN